MLALGIPSRDAAGLQQVCKYRRLARLRQPSFSTAALVLGRSAGPDVALVKSNPGPGECVSNQCDAARAGSKYVVARFGVQRPGKGLDAIQCDSVQRMPGYSPRVCRGVGPAPRFLAWHLGPAPRVLAEYGKVMFEWGGM